MCVSGDDQRPEENEGCLEGGIASVVNCPTWVLGTELGSTVRVSGTFNYCAIPIFSDLNS